MLSLSAQIRKKDLKKSKSSEKEDFLPAVLYGPKIKNLNLKVNSKEFDKVYQKAGKGSFVSLDVEGKNFSVLIQDVQLDFLTGKPIHIDFYQPSLEKEVEAVIPIIFEGEAPAVKDLKGTLIKNILKVKIKALPQNLIKEIKVSVEKLKTFEDHILVSDLNVPAGVKILKDRNEIVASVCAPEKVEEELAKPVEEKVEEVKKVEKKVKEKEESEEEKVKAENAAPERSEKPKKK